MTDVADALVAAAAAVASHGEARLGLALDAAGMGTWEWDVRTGVTLRSAQHARLFGIEADDFSPTYDAFLERVHPEDVSSVQARLAEAIESGQLFEDDFRIRLPDGTVRWMRHRGQAQFEGGIATRVVGVVFDVTAERAASQRSRRLLRLSETLAGALTPADVAAAVLNEAVPAVEAQAGTVLMVDESGHRVHTMASLGYPPEVLGLERVLDVTDALPACEAVLTGWPVVLPTRDLALSRYPELNIRYPTGFEGMLALPLVLPDRRIGALVFEFSEPLGADMQQLALAQTLAAACAQALERARLYAVSVGVAETLQRQLLPARLPEVPGIELTVMYLPATDDVLVGGDFYDVVPLSDGLFGLVLGDVMGKGVRSAAIMGQVRTVLSTVARISPDPAEVLARTDELLRDIDADAIVTCFYGVLNPTTGEVRYSDAGHIAPLLVRRDGFRVIEDLSVDPPLGAGATERTSGTFTVTPGTMLLVTTDGLVEDRSRTVDAGLAELGRVATLALLDDASLGQVCERAVSDLLHGRRNDDVALLALRLLPPATVPDPRPGH